MKKPRCLVCRKELDSRQGGKRYCSDEHRAIATRILNAAAARAKAKPKTEVECPICGEMFTPSRKGHEHCSIECLREAQREARQGATKAARSGVDDQKSNDVRTLRRILRGLDRLKKDYLVAQETYPEIVPSGGFEKAKSDVLTAIEEIQKLPGARCIEFERRDTRKRGVAK